MTTSELLRSAAGFLVETITKLETNETIRAANYINKLYQEADRLEGVEQAEAIKQGGLKMGESIPSMWEDRGKPKPERLEEIPIDEPHMYLTPSGILRLEALNTLIRRENERNGHE